MTLGFIGAGNMASALVKGMLRGGLDKARLAAYDIHPERLRAMQGLGVRTEYSIASLAETVDTIVLAVKPAGLAEVLQTLKIVSKLNNVLSIAAGWPQEKLEKALPNAGGVIRAMPNTPVQEGEGVIVLNANHTLTESAFGKLRSLLSLCSATLVFPETQFDAVTAISGSGPAYVYLFTEALADAAVREGISREAAYTLAAQTIRGAATMVLAAQRHPGELKDAVASPGGATIEAIYALEKAGFRAAVMDAVCAAAQKSARMAKEVKQ